MVSAGQIIYLDNNATTQLDPAVIEEMLPYLSEYYGNPSSGYTFGRQVRGAIELARERVATLLGCEPGEIVFTGCGTESNNAAVNSALQLDPQRQHVVTTAVEHSATRRHCELVSQRGCCTTVVGVDSDGNLDLDELERAITPRTAIVTAMWANNETGVLFPVDKIAEIARRKRVLFHTDAIQCVGKIPIKLKETTINSLSLSAHKLHGPKGVGVLYLNKRSAFRPSLIGGSQENNRRAGTENVASIVGLGKAAECAAACLAEENDRVRKLRDRFEEGILQRVPETVVNGDRRSRLPNTSNLAFTGIEADAALLMLDRHHLCCSAGSACRTGALDGSHVLRAMSVAQERARGSMRFSFGRFNTDADVDKALEVIPEVIAKMRAMSASGATRQPAVA
ncbi:MAG TPA: cysteine desulfurase NifS [Chthoniobacterales bacterium]|jgi:cysteine desulfurase|nr:cysteine desulfurase NifS [Chthoniobacterales bacterium]